MATRKELVEKLEALEASICEVREELASCKDEFDWDNDDPEELFKQKYWNNWDNCPVGTLLKNHSGPISDPVLRNLSFLTHCAREGNWRDYIRHLRRAVRCYLDLKNS